MSSAHWFWLLSAGCALGLTGLFACRRRVAFCLGQIRWLVALVIVLRGLLWLWQGDADAWDVVALTFAAFALVMAQWWSRVWLVRTSSQELLASVTEGCERVRLKIELASNDETKLRLADALAIEINTISSGLQCLTFPWPTTGKLHLLECLLRKRYARIIPALALSSSRIQE